MGGAYSKAPGHHQLHLVTTRDTCTSPLQACQSSARIQKGRVQATLDQPAVGSPCTTLTRSLGVCQARGPKGIQGFLFFLKILFIVFREVWGEREGKKYQCVVASHMSPYWGPGPQSRHVPQLGIKLATLWFTDQYSIH